MKIFNFDVSCLFEYNLQVRNYFYFKRFMRKKQVHHRKNTTIYLQPAQPALINQNDIFINNLTNHYLIK